MIKREDVRAQRRKPVINLPEFIAQHEERERQLFHYATQARGRRNLDDRTFQTLLRRNAPALYATNSGSRIAYARAIQAETRKFFSELQDESFHFLTFTPRHFAYTLADAGDFRHRAAIKWINEALDGYNYWGMLDAAFYSNWTPTRSRKGKAVSWHAHLVVWNCSDAQIEIWVDHANRFFEPFVPGRFAALVRHVSSTVATGRALYAAKAPLNDYRVWPIKTEIVDPETGEVVRVPLNEYKQRKQELRPGDASSMCKVLGERRIPQLVLAGGSGIPLASRIDARATRILQRKERLRKKRLAGPRYRF